MKNIRIIPRLDIKGPNLVKGIQLEGLRVLGKPWDYAFKYYNEGADELLYIDAVASLYGRNNLLDIIRKTAENIFIPLTVGGGIRSIEDIKNILRAGADKVAINTAAVSDPDLITRAAKTYGSQCIVGSIQAKKIGDRYFAYTDNAREATSLEVVAWAKELVRLGAGELLITSIDRDGTAKGFETELIREISTSVPVPVIAYGGCGSIEDVYNVISSGKADAVCVSSMFHYYYLEAILTAEGYESEGNIEFIKNARGGLDFMTKRLKPSGIPETREFLFSKGILCRTGE